MMEPMEQEHKSTKGLSQETLERTLEWAYEKALSGVGPFPGAIELANSYRGRRRSVKKDADALIRWQVAEAGATGFVLGFGGLITLPVTIPAGLAWAAFFQLRLIAAIAHLGGHDLNDDEAKTLCLLCLCGAKTKDVLKEVAIAAGERIVLAQLKRLPGGLLISINRKVGLRLLTKFGSKGIINLHRAIPVLSALTGGTIEAASTWAVGNVARELFIEEDKHLIKVDP